MQVNNISLISFLDNARPFCKINYFLDIAESHSYNSICSSIINSYTLTILRREADGQWRLARDANLLVAEA